MHKLVDYVTRPKIRRPDMRVKRSEHGANHTPPMWLRVCEVSFIIWQFHTALSSWYILHGTLVQSQYTTLGAQDTFTSCSSDSVAIHWPPANCLPISTRIFPPHICTMTLFTCFNDVSFHGLFILAYQQESILSSWFCDPSHVPGLLSGGFLC